MFHARCRGDIGEGRTITGRDHCERFESGRTSGIGDREVIGAVSKSSKVEASDDLRC